MNLNTLGNYASQDSNDMHYLMPEWREQKQAFFLGGGALIFKGGYHARVQKHGKRVVFQGEARIMRAMFRCQKQQKSRKRYVLLGK